MASAAMDELRVGHYPVDGIHWRAGNIFSSQGLHLFVHGPGGKHLLENPVKFLPVNNPLQGIFEMGVTHEVLPPERPAKGLPEFFRGAGHRQIEIFGLEGLVGNQDFMRSSLGPGNQPPNAMVGSHVCQERNLAVQKADVQPPSLARPGRTR